MTKFPFVLAMLGIVACSSDNTSEPHGSNGSDSGAPITGTDPDASTDCSLRTDLDTYTADMKKTGSNGRLSFQLVESTPAPPIKGTNSWTVKITSADGTPVAVGVTAAADMPEHGHSNPIQPVLTFDKSAGTYSVTPVYFSMVGRWRVKFIVADPKDPTLTLDSAEFNFCAS